MTSAIDDNIRKSLLVQFNFTCIASFTIQFFSYLYKTVAHMVWSNVNISVLDYGSIIISVTTVCQAQMIQLSLLTLEQSTISLLFLMQSCLTR